MRALNLPSASLHPEVIDDYLKKEGDAECMVGQFTQPPFSLSAPEGLSINDHINLETVTLSYTTINDAVQILHLLGRGTLLAKMDFSELSDNAPSGRRTGPLLRGKFYHDKCLHFGLRSSPFLFDTIASALEYIFTQHLHNPHIIHYLDDFLLAGPPHSTTCRDTLLGMKSLCQQLGVATKEEKHTPPTTTITFLRVEIDTVQQTITRSAVCIFISPLPSPTVSSEYGYVCDVHGGGQLVPADAAMFLAPESLNFA